MLGLRPKLPRRGEMSFPKDPPPTQSHSKFTIPLFGHAHYTKMQTNHITAKSDQSPYDIKNEVSGNKYLSKLLNILKNKN